MRESHAVEVRAPGRVNIIGEHTDYNDGFVLPCAIAYDTRVGANPRSDRRVVVRSRFGGAKEFDLDRLPGERIGAWSDYARGVIFELRDAGVALQGADLDVSGTVPLGAGLSSSASFEVALALALLAVCGIKMERSQLALLAQRAEIEYVGARVGIMDQFAVLFASEGHALFLDTRSLNFERVPVPAEAAIVICNTMVKHDLASSGYNRRREECERSVELLRQRYPAIRALRDVSVEQLAEAHDLLPPELLLRARHVVTENERVVKMLRALKESDLERAGGLMYESHRSLRDDYAVSSPELDTMVDLSRRFDGTIGARMTGAGFGGCTVTLVHAPRAAEFRNYISGAYFRETGITPELYDGTPSAGASVTGG